MTDECGWGVSALIVSDSADGGMEGMMDRNVGMIIRSTQRALKRGDGGSRWTWNGSARIGTERQTCKDEG